MEGQGYKRSPRGCPLRDGVPSTGAHTPGEGSRSLDARAESNPVEDSLVVSTAVEEVDTAGSGILVEGVAATGDLGTVDLARRGIAGYSRTVAVRCVPAVPDPAGCSCRVEDLDGSRLGEPVLGILHPSVCSK